MSNWIKCSERLPESCGHNVHSKNKLVYVQSSGCQFTATLNTEAGEWYCFFSGWKITNVTHWSDLIRTPEGV